MMDTWSKVEIVRTVFLAITAVAIFQQLILCSHYWWRIIPLRKVLRVATRDGKRTEVIAPPIGWTFAYHLTVLAHLLWNSTGTYLALRYTLPANPVIWFGPVISIAYAVVINRFVAYYSDALNQASWSKLRRDDTARADGR